MTSDDETLLNALCWRLAGKPASECDWRNLIGVRDHVDRLLNSAVNERQFSASTPPASRSHVLGSAGAKAGERAFTSLTRSDPACADPARPVVPVAGGPGGTTNSDERVDRDQA